LLKKALVRKKTNRAQEGIEACGEIGNCEIQAGRLHQREWGVGRSVLNMPVSDCEEESRQDEIEREKAGEESITESDARPETKLARREREEAGFKGNH